MDDTTAEATRIVLGAIFTLLGVVSLVIQVVVVIRRRRHGTNAKPNAVSYTAGSADVPECATTGGGVGPAEPKVPAAAAAESREPRE